MISDTARLLRNIGMKPGDSIADGWVSRSIERAQARLAKRIWADPSPAARSAAEWVRASGMKEAEGLRRSWLPGG